ncbi:hypothetical protein [Candidatus Chloroploca sp. Khr17]|uniref:hypothetical protein n=1 Tax=Candidatus Chloroploca sp. Khr17 TaxID=2496869 RepID=UPI00101DF9E0|nr:hypothetical protein [Candidatus Chloroploca sp. Khr17]
MANHGGARPGTGRTIVNIQISLAHAQRLRLLLLARPNGRYSKELVQAQIERWIDDAYSKYEDEINIAEETAWTGEIL